MIKFNDLSTFLKFAAILGFIAGTYIVIAFTIGMILATVGATV
jgi:hypothetical protein